MKEKNYRASERQSLSALCGGTAALVVFPAFKGRAKFMLTLRVEGATAQLLRDVR